MLAECRGKPACRCCCTPSHPTMPTWVRPRQQCGKVLRQPSTSVWDNYSCGCLFQAAWKAQVRWQRWHSVSVPALPAPPTALPPLHWTSSLQLTAAYTTAKAALLLSHMLAAAAAAAQHKQHSSSRGKARALQHCSLVSNSTSSSSTVLLHPRLCSH